jgi:hypothetical protein
MKTIIRSSAIIMALAGCSIFNSCQKSVDVKSAGTPALTPEVQKATQLDAVNGAFDADNFDNDMNDIAMSDNSKTDLDGKLIAGGAQQPVRTYYPSSSTYPHTLVVDYGTGFTTKFGVVKTGKVISYYSAPLAQTGAKVVTTFQNYTTDGNKVEGANSITNITTKNDGHLVFHHVSARSVLYANGNVRKLITDKVYFTISTPNIPGAILNNSENYIAGSTIGTDVIITKGLNGITGAVNTYWVATVDPFHLLHKMSSCQFNDGGIMGALVYPLNTKTALIEALNYGDNTCDDSAVLTYKGSSTVIELPLEVWPFN